LRDKKLRVKKLRVKKLRVERVNERVERVIDSRV